MPLEAGSTSASADFAVGGRRYGLFAHDFRQVPVGSWLELVTDRALAQDFTLPPRQPPQLLVQSQPEFAGAARQALRDLRRPDLLARNPLLRTRLIRDRAGDREPGPALLGDAIREAVGSLRAHPRDDKLYRAVERTYAAQGIADRGDNRATEPAQARTSVTYAAHESARSAHLAMLSKPECSSNLMTWSSGTSFVPDADRP